LKKKQEVFGKMRFLKREMHPHCGEMHSAPYRFNSDKPRQMCIVFHKVINSCGKLVFVEKPLPENPVNPSFSDSSILRTVSFPQHM
jgi:hypothetical protein